MGDLTGSSVPPRRWSGLLAAVIAIAVTVTGVAVVHLSHGDTQAELRRAGEQRLLQVPLQTLHPEPGYQVGIRLTGRVRPSREVDLGFEPAGRVSRVLVDRGDPVAAGEVLAALDTRRLESRLAELDARTRETRARIELARIEESRHQRLQQDNYVSRQALDQARTERLSLEARLAGLEGERARLTADLEDSTLRAPFDARVVERYVEQGSLVAGNARAFRLLDERHLEAHVGVPARLGDRFSTGEAVTLRRNGDTLRGTVRSSLPEVDPDSRTRTLVITLEPGSGAVPGDLVELHGERFVAAPGFRVPEAALVAGDRGLWAVLVAEPDGEGGLRLRRASVELLHSRDGVAFVRGTLEEGMRVVSAGAHRVFPGQRVRPADDAVALERQP